MYQAPVANTVNRAPARPNFQLAGRQVTQEMFYAVQQAKRAGKRCLFVTAGLSEISKLELADEDCPNCGGFGHMALEIIIAGPFKDAPQGNYGSGDENPTVHLRPAWHNQAWWSVVRDLYRCPVCNNKREIVL